MAVTKTIEDVIADIELVEGSKDGRSWGYITLKFTNGYIYRSSFLSAEQLLIIKNIDKLDIPTKV